MLPVTFHSVFKWYSTILGKEDWPSIKVAQSWIYLVSTKKEKKVGQGRDTGSQLFGSWLLVISWIWRGFPYYVTDFQLEWECWLTRIPVLELETFHAMKWVSSDSASHVSACALGIIKVIELVSHIPEGSFKCPTVNAWRQLLYLVFSDIFVGILWTFVVCKVSLNGCC